MQRTNCHPFRHGRWLWMHNGALRGFHETKRDLLMAVDPSLYADIEGSTDSEALFFLALTFGLADDPFGGGRPGGRARGEGRPRARGRASGPDDGGDDRRGVAFGCSATPASARAGRCSSPPRSTTLRQLHPEVEILHRLGDETRFIVSEPLRDLDGAWNEVPESSVGVIQPGQDEIRPFRPVVPA